jgi:hypothetical protein
VVRVCQRTGQRHRVQDRRADFIHSGPKRGVQHGVWRTRLLSRNHDRRGHIYTEDNDGNDTNANSNTDPINIILAAGALVHEACHVDQIRDGRWFNMSANEAEKECMMAGRDDFYEKLGAPQWLIDWNEGIKDEYRERTR